MVFYHRPTRISDVNLQRFAVPLLYNFKILGYSPKYAPEAFNHTNEGIINATFDEDATPIEQRIITSGLSFHRTSPTSLTTMVDREKLPVMMRDYVYISVPTAPSGTRIDGFFSEWWIEHFKTTDLYQSPVVKSSVTVDKQVFVLLFNAKREIIGHYTVQPTDIIDDYEPNQKDDQSVVPPSKPADPQLKEKLITSGVSVTRNSDGKVTTTIDREKLPEAMKNYSKFTAMSFGFGREATVDDFLSTDTMNIVSKYTSEGTSKTQTVNEGDAMCIYLFDDNNELLGYYPVSAIEIK